MTSDRTLASWLSLSQQPKPTEPEQGGQQPRSMILLLHAYSQFVVLALLTGVEVYTKQHDQIQPRCNIVSRVWNTCCHPICSGRPSTPFGNVGTSAGVAHSSEEGKNLVSDVFFRPSAVLAVNVVLLERKGLAIPLYLVDVQVEFCSLTT